MVLHGMWQSIINTQCNYWNIISISLFRRSRCKIVQFSFIIIKCYMLNRSLFILVVAFVNLKVFYICFENYIELISNYSWLFIYFIRVNLRACLRQPLDRLSLKGKIDSILKQALYNQQNYKKNWYCH